MIYRKDVDGLRFFAVVPVVLFHAGFELLSGGFVGVDIFFVISGYLITYMLFEKISSGNFSIVDFYERRARRILPALFFVLFVSLLFSFLWLPPSKFKEFAQSLVAVIFFSANIFFYIKSDYFSSDAEEKPLLHTWSLSVEEQFYIVLPLLLLALWRFGLVKVRSVMIVLMITSFIFSEYLSRTYPLLNFYSMPTRAWELLAGSLCAVFLFQGKKTPSNTLYAGIGLLLILASFFFLHEDIRFPSIYALLPVFGSCLIILYAQNTLVERFLSFRLFVGVGLISYSAYLWHQPLFALARIRLLGEPPLLLMIALSILSFLLAAFSWRWVEQPFRHTRTARSTFSRQSILYLTLIFSGFFVLVGGLVTVKDGFPERFSLPAPVLSSIARNTEAYACFDLPFPHQSEKWGCDIGVVDTEVLSTASDLGVNTRNSQYDFLVWGDSHLLVTYDAFLDAATQTNTKGFYVGIRQCPPLLGVHMLKYDQKERNCHALNNRVYEYVKQHKIPNIILVSRWSYYATGGYDNQNYAYIGLQTGDKKSPSVSRNAFNEGLERTLEAYKKIGTHVVLVNQIPEQIVDPEEAYFRAYREPDIAQGLQRLSVSKAEHLAMQQYVMDLFESSAQRYANVSIIDATDAFCQEVCAIGIKNTSYYFDEDHLSIDGAKLLTSPVVKKLRALQVNAK